MIAGGRRANEGSGLQRPAIGGAGVVYIVSSPIDVVMVVDMVNGEFDVVGVAQGSIRGYKLPAIAVVVRDSTVEDNEALWGRVVSTKLSEV